MLLPMPSDEELYEALLSRDPRFEGRYFVAVKSTKIFCRLSCPARNPKPENCHFYELVAQCIEAGYRPCKRCHPLQAAADADPMIADLLHALEQAPERRWGEKEIVARGYDPSTVRRSFKRHFGITFLEMARHSRLRCGLQTLSHGGEIIDAQLDAGFRSPSGFRSAFAKLLGESPRHFSGGEGLLADWIETPLGPMIAVCDQRKLHLLEFIDRRALASELKRLRLAVGCQIGLGRHAPTEQISAELKAYFEGRCAVFETPLALHGSAFSQRVWQALSEIPAGETRSYSDIARGIEQPTATRAVARANGANQIALVVPCHRVVGADGSLTGYGGGLWRKQKLIELERHFRR